MNTITVQVSEERLQQLQTIADNLGLSLEDLVLQGIDEVLSRSQEEFQQAANYVLRKNAELYRRLA